MLKNVMDALGKVNAKEVEASFNASAMFRKAALAYLESKEKSILKEIISDASLDRSDARLVQIAEIRALQRYKNIFE